MRRARRGATSRVYPSALVLAFALGACAKSEPSPADSARSSASTAGAAAAGPAVSAGAAAPETRTPSCPRTGHWIDCQVRERLIRSGLAPHDTSREALPALGPSPIVYRLGRGGLAVYLFPDEAARARAASALDTVKYVRGTRSPTMLSQATVIENDNLLGLLFSKNEQQIERVSDALMAGAPQP
ncbi:MAG TPA: hypothetical protein VJT85_02645 [Gemmatimonadaceae bacterium]|nr:hypothetical protein [Gemmatimonadaceae bacterium]